MATRRVDVARLRARIEDSRTPANNGREPPNVPATTLKLQAGYQLAAVPGLSLLAGLAHESRRMATRGNAASIPGHTKLDAAARLATRAWPRPASCGASASTTSSTAAPGRTRRSSSGHSYLFPLAPRTLRVSVQGDP